MLILYSHIIIELREKANSFRTETNAETQEPMVEIICIQYNLDLQFTRFFSLYSHKRPYLILFYSDWCYTCLRIEPIWSKLTAELDPVGFGIATVHTGKV